MNPTQVLDSDTNIVFKLVEGSTAEDLEGLAQGATEKAKESTATVVKQQQLQTQIQNIKAEADGKSCKSRPNTTAKSNCKKQFQK